MSELNQSGPIDQIVNKIYEEMGGPDPLNTRVIGYLRDLQAMDEFQLLADVDFYDIVGKAFKLNPKYFMTSIYGAWNLNPNVNNFFNNMLGNEL